MKEITVKITATFDSDNTMVETLQAVEQAVETLRGYGEATCEVTINNATLEL